MHAILEKINTLTYFPSRAAICSLVIISPKFYVPFCKFNDQTYFFIFLSNAKVMGTQNLDFILPLKVRAPLGSGMHSARLGTFVGGFYLCLTYFSPSVSSFYYPLRYIHCYILTFVID